MRLQSLELQGFKSFPDKTTLNFDRGMTVVVGPNGSGKSNISDAIRWVLGEISSKNMRGTKMEDVIFGGTDKRSPMGFAEVSLTIDNRESENRLPTDFDEVTITRRYYRSGDSEYMINRKPVRLKDITELFMNTGLGKTGYSMINQGKSTEIISQKSDERRIIFEEAAGISKYRFRKNEAERHLAQVSDNMVRITDIKDELEGRVGPLEKEAERAKKYLDLREQKKAADVSLWLFDVENVKVQAAKADDAFRIAEHELEMAKDTLSALETQSEKLYTQSQENQALSLKLERLIREQRDQRAELDSSFRVNENEIKHLQAQVEQTRQDLQLHLAASADAKARAQELEGKLQAQKNKKEELSLALTESDALAERTQALLVKAGEAIDENYETAQRLSDHLTDLKLEASKMEAAKQSDTAQKEKLEEQLAQIDAKLSLFEGRIAASQKALDGYKEKEEALQASFAKEEEKGEENRLALAKLQEEHTALRIDVTSKEHRREQLDRMESLFEGYSNATRYIMNAAKEGKLQGIFAPISHLIRVESKYGTAIETALGANMQNIAVKDEQTAKAAIALLKNANAGRATFYPLTSVKGNRLSSTDYKTYPGYIGVASELLDFDPQFSGIIDSLLGRTLIFDSLDHATVMAKATGFRTKTVTLDGQVINAGGSFTGGSVKQNTGLLTRSAEIDRLKKEIAAGQARLLEIQKLIEDKNRQLSALKNTLDGIAGKQKLLASMKDAENVQYQILLAQVEGDRRQKEDCQKQLSVLDAQNETYAKRLSALQQEETDTLAALAHAKNREGVLEEEEAKIRRDSEAQSRRHSELILQLTLAQKDIETAEEAFAAAKNTLLSLEGQIERAKQSITRYQEAEQKLRRQIKEDASSVGDMSREIEEMEAQRTALISENLQMEQKMSDLREKIKDRTRHKEKLFEIFTKAEAKRTQIAEQKDKLANAMWEEYGLTYTAATELHYPPVSEENRSAVAQTQTELKNKLRNLGSVNVNAIEEYQEVKERYDTLHAQWEDLRIAMEGYAQTVHQMESEMRKRFVTVMKDINENFQKVFCELFGGGHAELKLTDPENVLESGIEINVAPPGKIIKSLSLLSGGEQSFVAIALLFAILNVNPTPFCVLDEVEAALDEVNVERVADYAKRYSQTTQFIFITHRRGTMEAADMLYGVTMAERGISKVLSLNVSEVEQKTGIKF